MNQRRHGQKGQIAGFVTSLALLVALVTEWTPRSDANSVSWLCVVILLYPAIAPASPGKTRINGKRRSSLALLGRRHVLDREAPTAAPTA